MGDLPTRDDVQTGAGWAIMSEGELPLEPLRPVEGTSSAHDRADESGTETGEVDPVPGQVDEAGERWEPL